MKPPPAKEPPATLAAEYVLPDIVAMQALERGDATPEQQKRALNWIIVNAAGTFDLDFRVDSRNHAFVSGRRFVGLQIVKMLKLNARTLKE